MQSPLQDRNIMHPTFGSLVKYHDLYKENGFGITVINAELKISQISQMNAANSALLKQLKLGKFKTPGMVFADKFSHDLYDIQKTCEIERMLIDRVFELQNQKMSLEEAHVRMMNDHEEQVKKFQDTAAQMRKEVRRLQDELSKQKEDNQKLSNKVRKLPMVERELELTKNRIKEQERVLERERRENHRNRGNYAELQSRQMMYRQKCMMKSDIRIFKSVEQLSPPKFIQLPSSFIQSNDRRDQLDIQQGKLIEDLRKGSIKVKSWLMRFVQKINQILQIRLTKLQQDGHSPEEISKTFKHLKIIGANPTKDLDKDDFPYDLILQDFEATVITADHHRLEVLKYKAINQAKALDRDLVAMVVDILRKFNDKMFEALKFVANERQGLASEYVKFIRPELNGIEWIENFKVEENMDYDSLPTRLLSEAKKLCDAAKEKEKMARSSNKFQARCVYNIELLASNAEAFQKEELDPLKEEQLIHKISLEEKVLRQKVKKELMEKKFIESFGQIEQTQLQLDFEVSTIIAMEKFKMKTHHQKAPISQNDSSALNPKSTTAEQTTNKKMDEMERARREMMEREMEKVIERKKVNQETDIEI